MPTKGGAAKARSWFAVVNPVARAACRPERHERRERGQAIAELAISVVVILAMAVAVFDLGLGFYNSTLIVQGAREGARVAMDCGKSVTQIQSAALATAPGGSSVSVAPNPRPTCPPNNSLDTATTVTVTFNHQWITPFWGGGSSVTMSEAATSR